MARGLAIGDQIQWTNSGNHRTCFGKFDGSTIQTIAQNGEMTAKLIDDD